LEKYGKQFSQSLPTFVQREVAAQLVVILQRSLTTTKLQSSREYQLQLLFTQYFTVLGTILLKHLRKKSKLTLTVLILITLFIDDHVNNVKTGFNTTGTNYPRNKVIKYSIQGFRFYSNLLNVYGSSTFYVRALVKLYPAHLIV